MYTPAICLLIAGIVLLIINVVLLFRDYKETIAYPMRRRKLYINGSIILAIVGMITFGIIYIFCISQQLT